MALSGRKVRGKPIGVSFTHEKMSVAEIFTLMEARLQIADTAQSLAGTPLPKVQVIAEPEALMEDHAEPSKKPKAETAQPKTKAKNESD